MVTSPCSLSTRSVKLPSMSALVPIEVPLICTVASGTPPPSLSFTKPLRVYLPAVFFCILNTLIAFPSTL